MMVGAVKYKFGAGAVKYKLGPGPGAEKHKYPRRFLFLFKNLIRQVREVKVKLT